jgi:thioredoxin-related protein
MDMKRWIAGLLLLFPLFAAAETRDPEKYFFDPKLGNFQEELAEAKRQGKKAIMFFFEMDDCPWCARMKSTMMNQPVAQDVYKQHFLIFSIDTEGDTAMTDFKGRETLEKTYALENRVRATPTILFFDLEGNQIVRHTGPTKDVEEFLLLARYVIEGGYKDKPFARYKQQQAAR